MVRYLDKWDLQPVETLRLLVAPSHTDQGLWVLNSVVRLVSVPMFRM